MKNRRGGVEHLYLVIHTHTLIDSDGSRRDTKDLGCFTSEGAAKSAIQSLVGKEGFREHPDGFEILRVPLDIPVDGGVATYYG